MRTECEQLAADLSLDLVAQDRHQHRRGRRQRDDDDVVGDAVNVARGSKAPRRPARCSSARRRGASRAQRRRYEPIDAARRSRGSPSPSRRIDCSPLTSERPTPQPHRSSAGTPSSRDCSPRSTTRVDANAARLVTIIGSPGLGKTRLARELTAERRRREHGFDETRCDPAGSATFAPIADALREAAAITEAATEDDVVAALAARAPRGRSRPRPHRVACGRDPRRR